MHHEVQGRKLAPLQLTEFSESLLVLVSELISRSPYWDQEAWRVHIFLNPGAGGLIGPQLRSRALDEISRSIAYFMELPEVSPRPEIRIHESQAPGGIKLNVQRLCDLLDAELEGPNLLFLSFGGDGTHQEMLDGLASRLPKGRRIKICRIPMGTGNDGVDIASLAELPGIVYSAPVLEGSEMPVVRVRTARGHLAYSGNIAGVGMDAYVVSLSEDYKEKLPGKAYKIAADLGVLFYRQRFKLKEASFRVQGSDGEVHEFNMLPGIVSFGASGHRVFGQGLPVLPGKENTCLIPVGSLFQNIALKQQLYLGRHVLDPRVQMYEAESLSIDYPGRLPMQLDGELRWLEEADYPVVFERCSLPVRILRSRTSGAGVQSRQSQLPELLRPSIQKYPGSASDR